MDFLFRLFDTTDFPARWHCGAWTSGHGWLHILSDLGVWSAYVAIPCVLGYFLLRRQDLPFRKIFLLFGAFIFACGTTHLMEAIIFWWPAYRLAGLIKLLTAVVSWATVFALIPIVPRVMAMRSPEDLELEVAARKQAEAALQRANADLERRIEARTAELVSANAALQVEVGERRQAEERVQRVADGVPALISYIDADAHYCLNNKAYEKWFGRPRGDLAGKHMRDVLGEGAWLSTRPHIEAALAGQVVTYEAEVPYRGGGTRWISATYTPDVGDGGDTQGLVAHVNDITVRKRTENLLRESEQRFHNMADHAPVMIWVTDPSASSTYLNEQWYAFTGTTAEHGPGQGRLGQGRLGHGWLDSVHPDDRESSRARFLAANRRREALRLEYRLRRRDGVYRWVIDTATPRFDPDGEFLGYIGSVLDIDERKALEDDLRRLANELSEADRRKDVFLATLAHELRNPLAPLRNGLQVMKLAANDGQTVEQTRAMMERQLGQMVRLVDDLLDVSRITRNKLELRKARVNVAAAVHSAIETSRPVVEEAGHTLSVSLSPHPIYVDADLTRLAQVFSNLLNNSAKYTPQGGRIAIGADQEGDEVVVRVKDSGIGIPTAMLTKVFDAFTQGDRSLEKAQGGLGIGLTIVKSLVEMHGGAVEARSQGPGQGSEFVVRLPAVAGPASGGSAPTQEAAGLVAPKRKVLVVDDNQDSAKSLSMILALLGNDVRTAHDGAEAIEVAGQYRPELILMDVGMPKLNGFDATRHIREQPWGKSVVIVALTGWGQEDDRRKSREAGCDAHMVKPINPLALQELLAGLRETSRAGGA